MPRAAARCSCLPLGARTRARASAAERPPQDCEKDRASAATSPLAHFIKSTAKVDDNVIAYLTDTLHLKTISDFANLWTAAEYEKGIQSDIIQKVPGFEDASQPLSRLQTARLRTAWVLAQGKAAVPAMAADAQVVGMGWMSPIITAATFDGLWEALVCKARSPPKLNMDVCDIVVVDRPGYLARFMTINPTKERVEEHIYTDEFSGEIIHRLVDSQTRSEAVDERVIKVIMSPLRLEFFRRHASEKHRLYWKRPLASVKQAVEELVGWAPEQGDQGFRSEVIKGVPRDALWRSMIASIREPARFFDCSGVSVREREGFVEREVSAPGGGAYLEHIYASEPRSELVFRRLAKDGAEADVELAVALRRQPLQMEFRQRRKADGSTVNEELPRSAVLSYVEAMVRDAKRLDGVQPSTVGYGITSDPICGPSYDSVFAAVELCIKEPWRVTGEDERSCDVRACEGYVLRRMRLGATGECVVTRITANKELGEVTYAKCDASGRPAVEERVLAIHTPLRLEFYGRSALSGLRLDWKAPCDVARDTFSKIAQLARELETAAAEKGPGGPCSSPGPAQPGAA